MSVSAIGLTLVYLRGEFDDIAVRVPEVNRTNKTMI